VCDTATGVKCSLKSAETLECEGPQPIRSCNRGRKCKEADILKIDEKEFVSTYAKVKSNGDLSWQNVKTFVNQMKSKLQQCLIGQKETVVMYCNRLGGVVSTPGEIGPLERDDPICKYFRKYDDIITTNDGSNSKTNTSVLTMNTGAIIQNIIRQNHKREILKKVEVTGEKIMKQIRGLQRSMGQYFLALATYDEQTAIEDMDWCKSEMYRLAGVHKLMDKQLVRKITEMTQAVFLM
jgi:hypothetical protein